MESRYQGRTPILAVVIGLLVAAMVALAASPAWAAQQTITSAGPLGKIVITDQLNCQVFRSETPTSGEFYPRSSDVGACGTLLETGGTLYGPDDIPAGGNANPRTPFTPVSQTPVSGAGTETDPFKVVTVVDLGTTGLRITQTDSYVVGKEFYRTDVKLENTGAAAKAGTIFRAGDCYLQGSDNGFGSADAASGAVRCVEARQNASGQRVPGTRIEEFFPLTPGSKYYEARFSEVWARIGARQPFDNQCARCSEFVDNGAGLSWLFDVPAGGSATYSHLTNFSPRGNTVGNDPPEANDDSYRTREDVDLRIPARGVLANDRDPDGDPLTARLVSGPAHGRLDLNPDGSFVYRPNRNYNGTDTFRYRARDNSGALSNVATVTITVVPVNDTPTPGPRRCTITGTSGNDAIRGTNGRDVICGLGGNDAIRGLGGNDTIYGDAGNDAIRGDAGNDRIFGGAGRDGLKADGGNDRVFGEAGADGLHGGSGNDQLSGGEGGDALNGDAGNDSLRGGPGRDALSGGPGRDSEVQ